MAKQTRGERNNNPSNIDRDATKWQGMADDQSGDARFVVFKSPQYGIRACAKTLMAYQALHGLHTVRGLIGRWAPPGENNTASYVAAVAAGVGVGPDDQVDVDQVAILRPMVVAIIIHENGSNPYPDSVIDEGIRMAGVSDAKPAPLHQQSTFLAQAGTAVAGAGAAAVQYAPGIKTAADKLGDFAGSPVIAHITTVLLTVAGGLTVLGLVSAWLKQRSA